jgi:hypothetical protein
VQPCSSASSIQAPAAPVANDMDDDDLFFSQVASELDVLDCPPPPQLATASSTTLSLAYSPPSAAQVARPSAPPLSHPYPPRSAPPPHPAAFSSLPGQAFSSSTLATPTSSISAIPLRSPAPLLPPTVDASVRCPLRLAAPLHAS